MSTLIDLSGRKFTQLEVISRSPNKYGKSAWYCLCDCGNTKIISGNDLKSGKVKSCGCLRSAANKTHKTTHGDRKKRLYACWCSMHTRCTNPNFKNYEIYGGKGVTVCEEWGDYLPFKKWALSNGYSDNLTLDRINGNGNYEPSNCRWATTREQARNTTNTKLTPEKVSLIKQHLSREDLTQGSIAKMFNVSSSTISCIKRRIIWSDIS